MEKENQKEDQNKKAEQEKSQKDKHCKHEHEHEHEHDHDHEHDHCKHHSDKHFVDPETEQIDPEDEYYEKLLNQFKTALQTADKELKKMHNDMMDTQRIAVSYKKDLERYKERNKDIEEQADLSAIVNISGKLVPILDQFETALNNIIDQTTKKGIDMIYQSLSKAVKELGIVEINPLGEDFDSNFHNAVGKSKVKDKKLNGKVVSVYQKGYKIAKNNKVVRYAMVEVGEI